MGAEICAIGGERIAGQFWRNCWGEPFCGPCATNVPLCACCNRHICDRLTGGGVTYEDGRSVCNRCRVTAIDQPEQGRPVVAEVCRVLLNAGGLDLGDGSWVTLALLNRNKMERVGGNSDNTVTRGWARYRSIEKRGVRTATYTMEILSGLPRHEFAEICAHEMGHFFMYRAGFPDLSPPLSEGLCELCAYTWLMEQRTKEANQSLRQMWESTSPIYGEGFRKAYRAMYGHTLADVFDHVRRFGRLPSRCE